MVMLYMFVLLFVLTFLNRDSLTISISFQIVYSDGDVELLVLKNERWKLVESSDV